MVADNAGTQSEMLNAPPLKIGRGGFTFFSTEHDETPLFPAPLPEKLTVAYIAGGARTRAMIEGYRRFSIPARDLIHRAVTIAALSGHRPYAVVPILSGEWAKADSEAFLTAFAAAMPKNLRLLMPHSEDWSSDMRGASVLIWAEAGKGAPFHEPEVEDDLVVCVEMSEPDKPPFEYPNWYAKIANLWEKKYAYKKRVVRFALPIFDCGATTISEVLAAAGVSLSPKIERNSLRKVMHGDGVLLACSPTFTNRVQKRVTFLKRSAAIERVGCLSLPERT